MESSSEDSSKAESAQTRSRLQWFIWVAIRVVLFPWGIYKLTTWPGRCIKRKLRPPNLGLISGTALQTALYLIIGVPLTLWCLIEVVIFVNERLLGEQANYSLVSDFEAPPESSQINVPGPKVPEIQAVSPKSQDAFHRYLVELFSPVIVHKVAHHPEWDIPVSIKFDGNIDPRDNVANEPKKRPHTATVYGEVTAVTDDSIYLTYSLYHVKDYDHPVREYLTRWSYHDSDNEGFHIRVDRKTLELREAEMWFHNRFLLCNESGKSTGTEPVHGKLHTEDRTHLVVYAQSMGHGVRCAQILDAGRWNKNVKILRFRGNGSVVPFKANRSVQVDVTYELESFDEWYKYALAPLEADSRGIFEESIELSPPNSKKPLHIARYIAGKDYAAGMWSRPKPMWSWDDGWDEIPILVWHFFPSISFQSHGGSSLSHSYVFNRPARLVFDLDAATLWKRIGSLRVLRRVDSDKWDSLKSRGGHLNRDTYFEMGVKVLKKYVNHIFHVLG